MKIVVDTNIVFSAILNTNGKIGDLLFNATDLFAFFSSAYLQTELIRHKGKLVKAARRMTEEQIETAIELVFGQIQFVDENMIAETAWLAAQELVNDIDSGDIDFVALAIHLGATLWTGDKPLYAGLRRKGFSQVVSTDDMWDRSLGK